MGSTARCSNFADLPLWASGTRLATPRGMQAVRGILRLMVITVTGCGLSAVGVGPNGAPADVPVPSPTVAEAGAGSDASTAQTADAAVSSTPGPDGPVAPPPCAGVMCGSQCLPDCNSCASGMYACGATCLPSCAQCAGGADFVVCLECANGGPMTRTCSSTGSGGCLGGNYAHCPCTQSSQCPESNQSCADDGNGQTVCTACGESNFHKGQCGPGQSGGCCCGSGTNLGQCNCNCSSGD
jgi:hypothetical protein